MKLLTMGLAAGLLVAGQPACAQANAYANEAQRDPMLPPPVMRPAAVPGGASAADAAPVLARHLMVVDGVRWVIDGGRRRGVGDLLGGARIERIEDSAIVVRNGKQLQRLPLFVGVVKKPVPEPVPEPVPVAAALAAPVQSPPPSATATAANAATRTARAPAACDARPSCMQRPGDPP
jgi:hypothetical protein